LRRLDPREWIGLPRGVFLGTLALILGIVPFGSVVLRVIETIIPDPETKRLQRMERELRERLDGSGRSQRLREEDEDRRRSARYGRTR
jgi:hypothetical protein